MEFVVQKGETIIMEDDETYLVLKNIEFNNEAYLHVVKTGDDFFDFDIEGELGDDKYVKELIVGDDLYLEFVTDEALIEKLREL